MFKKAITSAVVATALLSGTAFAGGPDMPQAPECQHCFRPFIGVFYSYANVDNKRFDDTFYDRQNGNDYTFNANGRFAHTFNGLGVEAGAKYGPFFGFAFGMTHYFKNKKDFNFSVTNAGNTNPFTFNSSVQVEVFFLEARLYYPVAEGFDLIGAVGGNFADPTVDIDTTHVVHTVSGNTVRVPGRDSYNLSARLGWRFGIGADYFFTPNWGVAAMFHYMPMIDSTQTSHVQDVWTLNAGLYYMFS